MFYNTFQGIAFQDLEKDLTEDLMYPCIGMISQDGSVEVNFGYRKFKYAGNLF